MNLRSLAAGLAMVVAACVGLRAGGAMAGPDSPAPVVMRDISSLDLAKQMSPGINLGNTLEALPEETSWGNPPTTQRLMDGIRAAGFRTIRIPVSWSNHANSKGEIDRAWLAHVAQVVAYARKADLYVIINVHWDGGWLQPTRAAKAASEARLARYWIQIAEHFKDWDDHLLFAGTNEIGVKDQYGPPSAENSEVQNGFNQTFVDAVRATGGLNAQRHLIVQGYNTNIDATVAHETIPADTVPNRLMMEVHYYDPYNFTINDKSKIWQWGAHATDPAAKDNWGDEAYADAQFEKMKTAFIDKGVPVILGEYAAGSKPAYPGMRKYRLYWDQYITRSAYQHGLVPVYWEIGELFNRATGAQKDPEIIAAIVKAAQ